MVVVMLGFVVELTC